MSAEKIELEILQHSAGTPPGSVLEWAEQRGIQTRVHRLDQGSPLPANFAAHAFFVVLGGPMSVWEIKQHPWLVAEKAFLREVIGLGHRCLGLCLGGQLLSEVLGGEVRASGSWEVGWHDVMVKNNFNLGLQPGRATGQYSLRVFQWHQDCFSLPPGAETIAANEFSSTQGFFYGERVVGLQFHPESTNAFVKECADEVPYPNGPRVQKPSELIQGLNHQPLMKSWFFKLLDHLLEA